MIAENSTSYVSNSTGITAYQVFDDTNETKFKALQYSLFTTSFVEVIGGLFFLITAAYILRDKAKAEKAVSGKFFSRKLTNYVILVAFAAHMFHFFVIANGLYVIKYIYQASYTQDINLN